jgi:5-methylcytosine-specific restriction endonuclease McrA
VKNTKPIPKLLREKIKHRSNNRCEYMTAKGRCNRTTGLSIHHIIHRKDGGENSAKNLIHICGFHRRLSHGIVIKENKK